MKRLSFVLAAVFMGCVCLADEKSPAGEKEFIRIVVQSLIASPAAITFAVADPVIAIDNGEQISRDDLRKAWPDFGKRAFKKQISIDDFFAGVNLQMQPVTDNKRIMSNKRLLGVYTPQPGDLYCDASHVKDGVENFIGYDKAFIYIIRKVDAQWFLIGIGG